MLGTLVCPQLNPMPTQNDFNIVKAPGLFQYDGGLSNAPSASLNFRSIELGSSNRYSQIAMPWDADQMFFRRKQDTTFTTWREVIHSGNIGAYTQQRLNFPTSESTNSYHYLETGTDLLSIRVSPTVVSAAFLGSGAGANAGNVLN